MIFVEQLGGSGYPELRHAEWAGMTFTDVVFPGFLIVVGASMACTMGKLSNQVMLKTGLRRAVDLIALGLLFNAWSAGADLSTLRYYGVLQRIGVCSLLAAITVIVARRRPRVVALIVLVLIVGYGQWLARSGSGCGHTVLPQCNAAGSLDSKLIPTIHLYRSAKFPGYDPEGLASTAGALASVLIGWLAMDAFHRRAPSWRTVVVGAAISVGLLGASFIGPLTAGVPSIKRIWSPAFTLRSAAPVIALLAIVRLVDLTHDRWTPRLLAPLRILGTQALVVYMGQHIIGESLYATHLGTITAADWLATHWMPGEGDRQWLYLAIAMTAGWTVVASTRQMLVSHRRPAVSEARRQRAATSSSLRST